MCWMSSSCRGNARRPRNRSWAMPEKDEKKRDMAVNRRAYHDYFIDEKLEAGLILTGSEGKSVRGGRTNFRDRFVRLDGKQAGVGNVNNSPHTHANLMEHQPMRPRQLLLPPQDNSR